ncbi:hypothetical protein [Streptomyces neyagawaensis]|uniref:hypothetical protein n=1 Tax=Streptomyces neyagawaensis TaxID=42238 RepID=UPI003EBCC039
MSGETRLAGLDWQEHDWTSTLRGADVQRGGSTTSWVVGGCVAAVMMPVVLMVGVSGGGQADAEEQGGVGGGLKNGQVPAEYVPWVLKAGSMCDIIKPAVIAAQIEAESGWNPNAQSPWAPRA